MSLFYALSESMRGPVVHQWASVLLHFIWQGCLIAAVTSILLRIIRSDNARQRYMATLIGLGLCVLCPVLTWIAVPQASEPPIATSTVISESLLTPQSLANVDSVIGPLPKTVGKFDNDLFDEGEVSPPEFSLVSHTSSSSAEIAWTTMPFLRIVVFSVWCLFQILLVSRLFVGSLLLWRIKWLATEVSRDVQRIAEKTAGRIGLRRVPRILCSNLVSDAAAAGFLKSFVLVPTAWLTDKNPKMLEAVLAHEFSHIRRYDVWVNLLQRVVETVFFYHPAVWWLSKQIRIEREHCCDSEAIVAIGCRTTFAKTLEQAARYRAGFEFSFTSGLRGDQMSLLSRVNRVLSKSVPPPRNSRWQAGIVALCIPFLLVIAAPEKETVAQSPPDAISIGRVEKHDTPIQEPNRKPFAFVVKKPPSELAKVTLPDYVIEPPDVLLIEGIRLVEKEPYKLRSKDILQIVVLGTPNDRPIAGQYLVQEGKVKLGPGYGSVALEGLTIDKAEKAVRVALLQQLKIHR